MISIFSTTINFHINIHYTNYHTPLQLLYNFHFDYQEIFMVANQFYFTTNFIKAIKTGITHIKSSIQLFDLSVIRKGNEMFNYATKLCIL